MSTESSRQTVVVGVDGTAASSAAVRYAAAEASRRRLRLHAVHVVDHGPHGGTSPDPGLRLDLDAARQSVPGRVGGWVFRAGIEVDVAVSVVTGEVATQLARHADEAALVVIGTPDSLRPSSLPRDVAAACSCPVVMVGPFGDLTYVRPVARLPAIEPALAHEATS